MEGFDWSAQWGDKDSLTSPDHSCLVSTAPFPCAGTCLFYTILMHLYLLKISEGRFKGCQFIVNKLVRHRILNIHWHSGKSSLFLSSKTILVFNSCVGFLTSSHALTHTKTLNALTMLRVCVRVHESPSSCWPRPAPQWADKFMSLVYIHAVHIVQVKIHHQGRLSWWEWSLSTQILKQRFTERVKEREIFPQIFCQVVCCQLSCLLPWCCPVAGSYGIFLFIYLLCRVLCLPAQHHMKHTVPLCCSLA